MTEDENKLKRDEMVKDFVEDMVHAQQNFDNQKYGEFIIQTNRVQFYLTLLIQLRCFVVDDEFRKHLERSQFGQLIGYFNVCARDSSELKTVEGLRIYNESRNALAHKMFTDKKLSTKECVASIEVGDSLIRYLIILIDKEVGTYEKK
jgi:hypothetical protein